jgi:hypothetical protein
LCNHFHFDLGIIQRSRGGSAERRSAYQSRARLTLPNGAVIDYTARGHHVQTLMLAPAGSPVWAMDPKQFWRWAAAAEKRADAQEARLLELSLPRGLPRRCWTDIARKLAMVLVAHGMVVQVDIHCSSASDGKPYPHLHMMMSMRELENGKFAARKARHWNKLFHGQATALRRQIADFLNAYCKKMGVDYKADPRSNAARGLPTAEMTLPRWNFLAYQRSGKKSPWLEQRDRERATRARIAALEAECAELDRKIALLQLELFDSPGPAEIDNIERNQTGVSRQPVAPRPRSAPAENRPVVRLGADQSVRNLVSRPGEFSPTTTKLPRPPPEPDEFHAENVRWRPG